MLVQSVNNINAVDTSASDCGLRNKYGLPIAVRVGGSCFMLKIIGIQRKKGVYNGNSYDNVVLHCTETTPYSSDSARLIGGYTVERVKVRAHEVNKVFGGLVGCDSDLADLIGSGISIAYDRFQNPTTIQIVSSPPILEQGGGA